MKNSNKNWYKNIEKLQTNKQHLWKYSMIMDFILTSYLFTLINLLTDNRRLLIFTQSFFYASVPTFQQNYT